MYDGLLRLPLFIALILFSLLTLRDYYLLVRRSANEAPFAGIGYAFATCLIILSWNEAFRTAPGYPELPANMRIVSDALRLDAGALFLFVFAFVFATLGGTLYRNEPRGAAYSSAVTVFGIFYTVMPICHAPFFLNLQDAIFWGWLVSWCTFMSDTAAYMAGRLWGRTPAGFVASPNKTIEGYLGGLVLAVIFAFAFYIPVQRIFPVPDLSVLVVLAISVAIYVLSIFGDLVESMIKRDGSRKDAGQYLSGHGGLLDVVDSFLLVLPVSYHVIRAFQS